MKAAVVVRGAGSHPVVGQPIYDMLHGAKVGFKDFVAPQGMFADLGLKYVGPVDGHDVAGVESALRRARDFGGRSWCNCVTRRGSVPAPEDTTRPDCLHQSHPFDPRTGQALPRNNRAWTGCSPTSSCRSVRNGPTSSRSRGDAQPDRHRGLAKAYPETHLRRRIAEQHARYLGGRAGRSAACTSVVAIYSPSSNRAFDQMLMDVALHKAASPLVLDRAGITGEDGPSHNGMWDLLDPRCGARYAGWPRRVTTDPARGAARGGRVVGGANRAAFSQDRARRGHPGAARIGCVDVLRELPGAQVRGGGCRLGRAGAGGGRPDRRAGHYRTVVDPLGAPVPTDWVELAARPRGLVVTIEDSGRYGGIGSQLSQTLREADIDVRPARSACRGAS